MGHSINDFSLNQIKPFSIDV